MNWARFDHTLSPAPVIGVYDMNFFPAVNLPPAYDLIEITDAQLLERPSEEWAVVDGALVPYTPTPPPVATELEQQAAAALLAGIQLSSLATPSLDGTYDVTPSAQAGINGVIAGIGAGIGLPGGGATFNWPDTSGGQHAFSVTNFKNFAAAVSGYVYTLNQIVSGVVLTLPDLNITIA